MLFRSRQFGNPPGSRGDTPDVRRSSMFAAPAGQPRGGKAAGQGGSGQPDPMKTSFGYIGQDALQRQREQDGKRPAGAGRRRTGGGGGRQGGR